MIVGRLKKKKNQLPGFPCGSMVKNLPANAGDTGSISDPGRSHLPRSNLAYELQVLSLCSRFREPWLLKPTSPRACTLQQQKPLQWEAWASQLENSPHSNEDPAQPNSQNNKIKTKLTSTITRVHDASRHTCMYMFIHTLTSTVHFYWKFFC